MNFYSNCKSEKAIKYLKLSNANNYINRVKI